MHALTPSSLQSQKRDPALRAARSQEPGNSWDRITAGVNTNLTTRQAHHQSRKEASHIQARTDRGSRPRQSDHRSQERGYAASEPELPSTIPESGKARMAVTGTPSQGDTQPASQWVYDEFTDRSKEPAMASVEEGQTAHIDLLGAFEQASGFDREEIEEVEVLEDHDDDDIDPLSQDVRAEVFPEYKRFQQPKTPASHGTKRKRVSQNKSQEVETPSLPTNPFAGMGDMSDMMMGPSQLFKATQALTSPNVIPSDGLYERPSPDTHHIQRPSTAGTLSSPARMPRSNMMRAVTEPHATYVSMKESQEARERLRSAALQQENSQDDPLEREFRPVDTQLRRRLDRKRMDEEGRKQLIGIMARSRPGSSPQDRPQAQVRSRRRARDIRSSPGIQPLRRPGRQGTEAVIISDDPPLEDAEGNTTEDETEHEEEKEKGKGNKADDDEADELAEDNKENVEVPMTVSRLHNGAPHVASSQPTPSRRRSRKTTPFNAHRTTQPTSSPRASRSSERALASEAGTQPYAIADSQSSQRRAKAGGAVDPLRDVTAGPPSSLESRVLIPQSQLSQGPRSSSRQSHSPRDLRSKGGATCLPQSSPANVEEVQQGELDGETALQRGSLSSMTQNNGKLAQKSSTRNSVQQDSKELLAARCRTPLDTKSPATDTGHDRLATEESPPAIPSPRNTPTSGSKAEYQSHPSTLFETAQEHLINSPSKSHVQRVQQKSQSTRSSPSKTLRSRTIGEIAADPSPPDFLGDIDIDINILTSEDVEFQNAVRGSSSLGPPPRVRRGGRGTSFKPFEIEQTMQVLQSSPRFQGTPDGPPSSAFSVLTPIPTSSDIDPRSPARAETIENERDEEEEPPGAVLRQPREPQSDAKPVTVIEQADAAPSPKSRPRPVVTLQRIPDASTIIPTIDKLRHQPDDASNGDLPITGPTRVFAHFNGKDSAYYSATCLGVIPGEEPRYNVRFDDGATDTISASGIKRLELRIGDLIKYDGARTKDFVVRGMRDRQEFAAPETPSRRGRGQPRNDCAFPELDIHGFATVLISPKQRRSAIGVGSANEQIAVPLGNVFFTQNMWRAFKDRPYTHVQSKAQITTGLQTPSERPSTPSTPSSRHRRVKSLNVAQSRSMAIGTITSGGLFTNMVFALTNILKPAELERAKAQIASNGGRVLENGFGELFHVPELHRITSPKKKDADKSFHPTRAAESLGFTCLIADKHCRRAKYIQALALGIPCLATRWISDCIVKQRVLPWAAYLLPSGESAFLGGAVRSRILPPFPTETSLLSDVIENRPRMLEGASILLIMQKGEEDTMKQHPLLTFALSPARVSRAMTIEAAAKAVADAQAMGEPWDWVFSYDREQETEKALFGTRGKKRKRAKEIEMLDMPNKTRTRVVGNEFVIQSLILGQLVED